MQVKRLTEQTGQTFALFTLDQQYCTELLLKSSGSFNQSCFTQNFIIRLEKMDLLTSFVGVVSYFMTNIGLARVLSQVLHV